MLSMLGKYFSRQYFEIFFLENSPDYIIIYFLTFSNTFIHLKRNDIIKYFLLICMKCQSLFSGKSKVNIVNLSSAEFALPMEIITFI